MKTSRYLFTPSLVFLNMATLTKHRILRYESYFLCFSCFDIFPRKTPQKSRPIRIPEIPEDCCAETHLGSKIVPNSRERDQKSLKLMEWPEFPDDPPSESLRQRSSERKLREMPPRSPQEEVLFLGDSEAYSCNYPMDKKKN